MVWEGEEVMKYGQKLYEIHRREVHSVPSEHVTLSDDATVTGSNGPSRVVGAPYHLQRRHLRRTTTEEIKHLKEVETLLGVHRLWRMKEIFGGEKGSSFIQEVVEKVGEGLENE
ncbi:hypothetical protein QJS10_CPA01g01921 [Acorus calamus]|uniref:Uncharacterized protein n=1 Tax=Acorus calamus TaxID=4465 RepID=A0AAV9FK01_ACOCL|nr:hypothetical protein QJS10_CPA01g01921 [Acorus calamus]